jgi:chorismate mutase/ubiquinone/menaquinone biosynthesis C-methylase UbiE
MSRKGSPLILTIFHEEVFMYTAQEEKSNFDLETARAKVTEITEKIAKLFCERQLIMTEIAHAKNRKGEAHLPIFLPQREQQLLGYFRNIAKSNGVDPNMMDMLISMLMSAAKFAQQDILQRQTILDTTTPEKDELEKNLLTLTASVAQKYDDYEKAEGTHIECVREENLLEELTNLHSGGIAVNLGCANGSHVTSIMGPGFDKVIGYDISPDMIDCAKKRFPKHTFFVHDLDTGIPLEDESVDFIVANFGAASEVCREILWQETFRVLRFGGRAFFSFYNKKALVTKWWTPWSNSYRITINTNNDTIMVPVVEG